MRVATRVVVHRAFRHKEAAVVIERDICNRPYRAQPTWHRALKFLAVVDEVSSEADLHRPDLTYHETPQGVEDASARSLHRPDASVERRIPNWIIRVREISVSRLTRDCTTMLESRANLETTDISGVDAIDAPVFEVGRVEPARSTVIRELPKPRVRLGWLPIHVLLRKPDELGDCAGCSIKSIDRPCASKDS